MTTRGPILPFLCMLSLLAGALPGAEPAQEPVSFTMADIAQDEAEDAAALVAELNETAADLRARHRAQDTGAPYVSDWLAWIDLRDWAQGHSLWETEIESALEASPPAPPEEELAAWLEVERHEREQAMTEESARRERRAAERRETILLRIEEARAARYLSEEELSGLRRRIEVFNQRTNFRHADLIQRRIDLGRAPFPENLAGTYRKAHIVP